MKRRALQNPELIHLLRMHEAFPEASIRALIKGSQAGKQGGGIGVSRRL